MKGPLDAMGTVESSPPSESTPSQRSEDQEEREPKFQAKRRMDETEMDMTPMVDVVFQLLIFFMLTAAFALQKSIALPKSADDRASEQVVEQSIDDRPDYVIVRVDEFNTFHVSTADWDEEAPSVQDLFIRLRRARDGVTGGTVPNKLRVEAHPDALHGRVVAALDAGTGTGFEQVQLSTMEEEP